MVPAIGFPMLLVLPISERWEAVDRVERERASLGIVARIGDVLQEVALERALAACMLEAPAGACSALPARPRVATDAAVARLSSLVGTSAAGRDASGVAAPSDLWPRALEALTRARRAAETHGARTEDVLESYSTVVAPTLALAESLAHPQGAGAADHLSGAVELMRTQATYAEQGTRSFLARLRGETTDAGVLEDAHSALASFTQTMARLRDVQTRELESRSRALAASARAAFSTAAFFTGISLVLVLVNLGCLFLGYRLVDRWTGRLKSERDQAERLSWIAEHTHQMAIVADERGHIVWVNHGFIQLTGYDLDAVRQLEPEQLFADAESDESGPSDIPSALRDGRDVETDVRLRTRDGAPIWVRLEVRVLHDAAGAVKGFIAVGTDIGWRKRYVEALREANERFEQITRQSRDIIWEIDAEGTLVYVSAAVTDVLGYEPEELVGDRLEALFAHAADAEGARAQRRHLESLTPGSALEVTLQSRAGQLHYCLASAGPILDRSGRVTGFRGTFNDITARKLVELRLNASEGRLHRAMSGSSDGHWEVDLRTGQSFVSARFRELLGYAAESEDPLKHFDPADLQRLVHPDDLQLAQTVHRDHLEKGTPYDLTVRLRCQSGQFRWFRIRGATDRDATGTPNFLAGVLSDVTDLKLAEGELEWHVMHDSLTSLANRQQFLDRLTKLQIGNRRTDRGVCAILSMDFDRFKLVNDVYGHAAGDELLCSIARRLKDSVRETDLVARFGGDEFLVLLFDAESAARVQQIAARLCNILAQPHVLSSGAEVTSTASIGVIVLEPGDARPAELLLREADAAMYQAKAEAKGSYRFFAPELRMRMNRKVLLEADLRKADFDSHFRLVYQPIVNLHTGAITGFEALVRWKRNGEEAVSPAEFIPVAEDTALIVPIGRWIVRRACRDLVAWRAVAPEAAGIAISINVSRREIVEPDHCDTLIEIVRANGLVPRDIQIELTETALVGDRFDLIPHAKRLRDAGFSLSMDDFGTGQSSLNSLINLPIDTLKIDKEFVRHMTGNRASIAVVHAVITLAMRLELRVVAEGIEDAVEVATLQAMDCEFGQGYYFAAPMEPAKALELLRERATEGSFAAHHGALSNGATTAHDIGPASNGGWGAST